MNAHPRNRSTSSRSRNTRQTLRRAIDKQFETLESRRLLSGSAAFTVLSDVNNSGAVDAGDAPLSGWTVFVDVNKNGSFDTGEPSAVTNSSGQATISNLPNGKTDVGEVLPTGWTPVPGFDAIQRININNNTTTPVTFLSAAPGSVPTTGTIQGTVWNDVDGNGVRDAGDPGIPGWTVFLDLNTDRILNPGEPSTITDASGVFTFTNLNPDKYKVREITPAGWNPTTGLDGANSVTVTAGKTATTTFGNFNVASLGAIKGTVWNDVNADGIRALSDPGLGGWTVFLDLNHNGTLDAGENSTVTDPSGVYSFPSVTVGTYSIAEVVQPGWNLSPGHPSSVTINVVNEGNAGADFAVFTPTLGSVSGKVYNDANANGFPDVGEVGLSGWTVFIDANGDGVADPTEQQATTDSSGNYTISDVAIGSTTIREIPAVGFSPTAPGTGMQLVTVPNATNVTNINFGNKQRTDGTISGVAFADSNKNGVRDPGEHGLSGIPIWLDTNDNGVQDPGEPSTTTSADLFFTPAVNEAGSYSFTHLPTGTYHVRETVPAVLSATPAPVQAATFDLAVGEQRTNVNFANIYRANEIHGIVFNDLNKNHVRDAGEPGIAGVTVYIDLNRDNVYQSTEPRTVTAADGTYSFTTNLAPGSYVVRHMHQNGRDDTYPTTTGGILWPTGTSNPTIGNVTPTSITMSLAKNEIQHQNVSLTLPSTGALTDKVDVFLLFDDTGSFTNNSPIVRAAFPQIISTLQAALPTVDFGFGVGRFEEYANFAAEFSTGRPFILNQPIIDQATPGFSTAIQSALDRTAPGYGGDQPETDIEALFQLATGAGFDGNNNGTSTDSGAAGLVSTQVTPGASGDVPSFSSFTVDPSGNVLAPDGNIGGGGFRPGALPIVLLATDTGLAYQPMGETSIAGVNGLTLPLSSFTQTSRPTTPFGSGAGIQQTITALNALGALVVGLGTNGVATVDPRQDLEAIAKLTGAVNKSLTTIANGTADPIAPGDPLYFQISSGFGPSVANGIVTAIQNAVSNVAVDLTIKASDPTVHVEPTPQVINNVGAGQTATFDVAFEGDGRPHRFDLQFVRQGTDVVLGSIPVVLGTPIPGDGYEYEDLHEGQIEDFSDFGTSDDPTAAPNVAPSFSKGADQSVAQDSGPQTVAGWATNISPGPAGEASQVVDFIVSSDNGGLFSTPPSISSDGTLTYTPAAGKSGTATVSVQAHDTGGTFNGGEDTSAAQTFTIIVNSVVAPLTITSRLDFETAQALVLDFSQDVGTVSNAALQVVNADTNAAVSLQPVAYDPALKRAIVGFDPAVLPDGNYRLTIAAGALPNLATDHVLNFFVFAGDANRDRTVNSFDFAALATNFGTSNKTFSQGDFNYDGVVNSFDFSMLATRFGTTLNPPSAPPAPLAKPAVAVPNSNPFAIGPVIGQAGGMLDTDGTGNGIGDWVL